MTEDFQEPAALVATILSGVCRRPVYVLGRNTETKRLCAKINLAGLVDDFAASGTSWNGLVCTAASELPADAVVVNCASSVSPLSAEARVLSACPGASVLQYKDFADAAPAALDLPGLVVEMQMSLATAQAEWTWLRDLMHDEESRGVLDRLMAFRSSFDYHLMQGCAVRIKDQYFEDFLPASVGQVFVDCGGFDGDTTEEFCRRFPSYRKVYLFEPSSVNLSKAVARLKHCDNIEFLPVGVSDKPGELCFDPDLGSASAVSSTGSVRLQVTTIDEAVLEPVTFIKMDLEGWEIQALKGAARHIIEDHPLLAIAVYHKADDFWQVARLVLGLREDYQVYLRHYTEGWSETVMFFVPVRASKSQTEDSCECNN